MPLYDYDAPVSIPAPELAALRAELNAAAPSLSVVHEQLVISPTDTSEWFFKLAGTSRETVLDGTASSGSALRCTGNVWAIHRQLIPFDPQAQYKLDSRYRQVTDPVSGGKSFFAGLTGVTGDRKTLVNIVGALSEEAGPASASQHYGPTAASLLAGGPFTDFTYYWRGLGTPGTAGSLTPPGGVLDTRVRYVRLLYLVNYNAGDGVADVDTLRLSVKSWPEVLADPALPVDNRFLASVLWVREWARQNRPTYDALYNAADAAVNAATGLP